MDWQYDHPAGDGPARKRPHYDPTAPSFLSRPSPLFASPSPSTDGQPHSHGSGPAFLFHTPDALRPATSQHGPALGAFSFDPNAFNPVTAFGIPEVEMDIVAPGQQAEGSHDPASGGSGGDGAAAPTPALSTQSQAEPTSPSKEPRRLAGGAIKRELRKRFNAALGGGRRSRRGGRSAYVEDDVAEDDSASSASASDDDGHSIPEDDDRRPSSRRPRPTSSSALTSRRSARQRNGSPSNQHLQQAGGSTHYNLHMPGSGGHDSRVAHGEVPYILLGYLQFFFNLSLVLIMLYLAVQFILTVRADIQRKVEEASFDIVQEIASCTASYLANHCEPSKRVPAMHQACTKWEYCMNRDPLAVGRAQVGAETFAGVVNGFVDPISWKTMGFTLVTLSFLTILTNSALSFYRASHRPSSSPPPHAQHQRDWLPPAQTHYAGLPRPERADPYAYGGGAWAIAPHPQQSSASNAPSSATGPSKRAGWFP